MEKDLDQTMKMYERSIPENNTKKTNFVPSKITIGKPNKE